MKLVYGEKGNLKEYRQTTNIKGQNEVKFKPENIFHLSNNKISDQIHGISDIDAVEKYIQADAENFDDMKKIMHRGARPMILWKLKTDDTTKIAQFISRIDAARNLGEDMFIPDDEDIVTHEIVQVDVSANVLAWRDTLRNSFYRTIGLPQIVPGSGGQSTESESKVIYLAFEQIVEKDQRYLERQIKEQLGLNVNFLPPSTLSQDLQSDEAKDTGALSFQPNDSQVGGI
jgi:phage portal protein BeeE